MPRATPRQPSLVEDFAQRARAIHDALLVVHGERHNTLGVDDVARMTAASLDHLRNGGIRADAGADAVNAWVDRANAALEALDDLERIVRPAIEHGRDIAARLAADVAAAEADAAEAAREARRAAELEAAIRDEVQAAEQRRLAQIEADARTRLTTTGAR